MNIFLFIGIVMLTVMIYNNILGSAKKMLKVGQTVKMKLSYSGLTDVTVLALKGNMVRVRINFESGGYFITTKDIECFF